MFCSIVPSRRLGWRPNRGRPPRATDGLRSACCLHWQCGSPRSMRRAAMLDRTTTAPPPTFDDVLRAIARLQALVEARLPALVEDADALSVPEAAATAKVSQQ